MKRVIFYSTFLTVTILPCIILLSFSALSFLTYKSLQNPQHFAQHNTAWTSLAHKRIYINIRKSWQSNKHCAIYDEKLLYTPSSGCTFETAEFKTELSFDENGRISPGRESLDKSRPIFVLGDSHAMGWGVNDNETFSHLLETNLRIPVYNLGVSSYGTVREIERGLQHPEFKEARCLILAYDRNDKHENITFLENGALPLPTRERFHYLQNRQEVDLSYTYVAVKTFEHFLKHPGDIFWFFRNRDRYSITKPIKKNDRIHADIFLKVIRSYPELHNKNIFVIGPQGFIVGLQGQANLPNNVIPMEVKDPDILGYYPIDGHENNLGHKNIAHAILNVITADPGYKDACSIPET